MSRSKARALVAALGAADAMVDILLDHLPAGMGGDLPKRQELRLGILGTVASADPGVNGCTFRDRHLLVRPIILRQEHWPSFWHQGFLRSREGEVREGFRNVCSRAPWTALGAPVCGAESTISIDVCFAR